MDMDEQKYKNGLAQGRKEAITEILEGMDNLIKTLNTNPYDEHNWGRKSAFHEVVDMIFAIEEKKKNGKES